MKDKLEEWLVMIAMISGAFFIAICGILTILLCQPFFWLAVIAIFLIMHTYGG